MLMVDIPSCITNCPRRWPTLLGFARKSMPRLYTCIGPTAMRPEARTGGGGPPARPMAGFSGCPNTFLKFAPKFQKAYLFV